jgi:hypothetical protein
MAVSLASVTLDTLELLYGTGVHERPAQDVLTTAVSSDTDTTFHFQHPSLWEKDDYAEYWAGDGTVGEVVIFADKHDNTAGQVRRGQLRTTAAASYSSGDTWLKNPPYPVVAVQRAINQVVDTMLRPDVWMRTHRELDYTAGTRYYELAAADYEVERVYQYDLNSATNYQELDQHQWDVLTDLDTDMVSSGRALILRTVFDSSAKVHYTAKTKPTAAAITSLPDDLGDMISWGAAFLLSSQRVQPLRHDPKRSGGYSDAANPNQHQADARYFRAVFEDMKRMHRNRLYTEQGPVNRYRRRSNHRRV